MFADALESSVETIFLLWCFSDKKEKYIHDLWMFFYYRGQGHPTPNNPPYFGPSRKLDFELEMVRLETEIGYFVLGSSYLLFLFSVFCNRSITTDC